MWNLSETVENAIIYQRLQNGLPMTRYMAADIDRARQTGNMRRKILDIHAERRRVAAKALRPDIERIVFSSISFSSAA